MIRMDYTKWNKVKDVLFYLSIGVVGVLLVSYMESCTDRAFAPSCSVSVEDRTSPNKTVTVYLDSGQDPSVTCDIPAMVERAMEQKTEAGPL